MSLWRSLRIEGQVVSLRDFDSEEVLFRVAENFSASSPAIRPETISSEPSVRPVKFDPTVPEELAPVLCPRPGLHGIASGGSAGSQVVVSSWSKRRVSEGPLPPMGNYVTWSADYLAVDAAGLLEPFVFAIAGLASALDAVYGRIYVNNGVSSMRPISSPRHPGSTKVTLRVGEVDIPPIDRTGGHHPVECLPRMEPWISVLGTEYVGLFGERRIQSLPVYRVWSDLESRKWIQMTALPEQMHAPNGIELARAVTEQLETGRVFCQGCRSGATDPTVRGLYDRPAFDWGS